MYFDLLTSHQFHTIPKHRDQSSSCLTHALRLLPLMRNPCHSHTRDADRTKTKLRQTETRHKQNVFFGRAEQNSTEWRCNWTDEKESLVAEESCKSDVISIKLHENIASATAIDCHEKRHWHSSRFPRETMASW